MIILHHPNHSNIQWKPWNRTCFYLPHSGGKCWQTCAPWKTWNFVIFFSRPGKCLEFTQKVVKTRIFNSKPGKNLKFVNSMFQALLFKMSFTKIILIYFFVKSKLSTQTLIQSQIDLGFHSFYLEITWKIHGILFHKRIRNLASVLTHFKIFPKKTLKNLEFGPKILRKPGICYLGKKWEPCHC